MVIKFPCTHCGQGLFVSAVPSIGKARCPACGKTQPVPRADQPVPGQSAEIKITSSEADVYELARPPLDPPRTSLWKPSPVLTRPSGTDSVWALIRESTLGASQLQELSLCLIALSVADIVMTFTLLRTSHVYYESNPIAGWFFTRWNMTGMVVFKFAAIATAIATGEIIERRRPGMGKLVLIVGCMAAAAVVWHGLRLYMGVSGLPVGGGE